MKYAVSLSFALILTLLWQPAMACTVMRLSYGDRLLIARNHDWGTGGGLLIVNPRGISKKAITPVNPAEWTSKYGSVSFAQFGREIPFAGMNEKGLTVDLLQLTTASFPPATSGKPSVNVVQWVQYQLDTAATVGEVLASLERIDPMPFIAVLEKVHYFVTDAEGNAAIIEYLDGKPVVQHNPELGCVLANSTWEDSATAVKQNQARNGSEQRFVRARQLTQVQQSDAPVDDAIRALRQVAQAHTQWGIVYETQSLLITFRTRTALRPRRIDLKDLDFEANAEVLCVDINVDLEGDVTPHLEPFTKEANRRIIDDAFDAILPPGFVRATVKEMVLNYGESLRPVGAK